jgi:hypothetical protein
LLEATGTGAAFTTTMVEAELLQVVVLLVTVKVYSPAMASVALFDTRGLCCVEEKPDGPLQE